MFGHDGRPTGAMPETPGAVLGGSAGAGGTERAAALGIGLRAWPTAGWRAEIRGTHGQAIAGRQRAGDAAIRRTESLGLEAGVGAVGPTDGPGVGAGCDMGDRRHRLPETG